MNPTAPHVIANDSVSSPAPDAFEETLRLIASLPAPVGLEDRVHAGLLAAPRRARVLAWPAALRPGSVWMRSTAMRSAAAAAIVAVVAGGGWGVYSRVQQSQPPRVIAVPPHAAAQGGFSNAGAMRTPQTLNGPVLAHPVTAKPPAKASGKAPWQTPLRQSKPAATGKAVAQPAAPAAK